MLNNLSVCNSNVFNTLFEEMKVDIVEKENEYILYTDVPGLTKDQVKLIVTKDGILTINLENQENMRRSFAFKRIDTENVEATTVNGVLVVTIPKLMNAERKIKIKSLNENYK